MSGKPQQVRVASVQFAANCWPTQDSFFEHMEHYVRVAADYRSQIIVFPELFTLPLAAVDGPCVDVEQLIDRLTNVSEMFIERVIAMATRHRLVIVAGSHLTRDSAGQVRNVCTIALPDGTYHQQTKVHPTPDESVDWGVVGGDQLKVIATPVGRIAVLICYDSQFPELGRELTANGADIVLVPYLTDTEHGHLRVRHCSHARAIENQIYLVLAGGVGLMSGIPGQDIQYAVSSILTPIDLSFSRAGIAAEATPNQEQIIFADLDLQALHKARAQGFVRNWADRRTDLYQTQWKGRT